MKNYFNHLINTKIFCNKPILVTGIYRSGSTWLGNMISLAWNIYYIHEPFNIEFKHKNIPFKYQYEYINNEIDQNNNSLYSNYFRNHLMEETKLISQRINKNYPSGFLKKSCKKIYNRVLIKDPFALFSTEWLVNKFNVTPVLLIRHPAAVYESFKSKNWSFNFNNFYKQSPLIQKHLISFEKEITQQIKSPGNQLDNVTLLWNIIHKTILKYKQIHKDWIFIKHEDLSLHPITEFEKLYKILGLYFSNDIKKVINEHTNSNKNDTIIRNSKNNITKWKHNLNLQEIKKVYIKTNPISQYFYNDSSWS